ncbi:MAG: transcription antitermination factor NusB [Lentisphaeraceae bacterium]|nr:transcription antitermination factor NusB [Lentisphaeraceae bacterium]
MSKGKKISPRHLAREWAIQFMYQLDLREAEFDEKDLQLFWQQLTTGVSAKKMRDFKNGQPFSNELIRGTLNKKDELDALLQDHSSNWSLTRMPAVDRNILRLGAYEILHTETPAQVAIQEAIDVATVFSDKDSPSFINAILDQINKKK